MITAYSRLMQSLEVPDGSQNPCRPVPLLCHSKNAIGRFDLRRNSGRSADAFRLIPLIQRPREWSRTMMPAKCVHKRCSNE